MGLEDFFNNMDEKKKKLFNNLISVSMIFIILYGLLKALQIYSATGNYMAIFGPAVLVPTILPFIMLYFAYALINGKKLITKKLKLH